MVTSEQALWKASATEATRQRSIAAMEESEEQVLQASPVVTSFQTPGLERLFDLWSRTSKTGRAATPGATEEQQRHESMAPRQN